LGGIECGFLLGGGVMIRMLGVSLVRHPHGHVVQRHGCSHVGIVFSRGSLGGYLHSFGKCLLLRSTEK
jgi:hypothetical protein